MMPPPGRPMLPSSSCSSAQQPMICGPLVCCVHATAYANDVVRSRAGVGEDRLGDLEERLPRAAGRPLDHLRRVAAEVALDDLEDAARVLQRLVALRRRLQQRPDQRVVRRARRGGSRRAWLRARRGCPASRRTARSPPTLPWSPTARAARTASSRSSYCADEAVVRPLRDAAVVLHQPGEDAVDVLGVLELRRR